MAIALSVILLPIFTHAAPFQTYVIATYGGETLLPAVRQQLSASADGGSVTTYQDKLVLNTTPANYQAVQQLLTQIDTQPQALTVAVRVGNNSSAQGNIRQGQVIINNQGIQGSGIINQSNNQQQSSSLYQVQTLSGSAASISTGMLWSLTQNYNATIYSPYNQSSRQIIIQQQVLLPTTQGIQVIPRLLANGQVEVQLAQVNEVHVKPNLSYNQGNYHNRAIQYQSLNTRITVPRGQWVTIGQISQNLQNQRSNMHGNSAINSNNSIPIQLLVQ
ncbi:hypothetical protein AOC03_06590 [Psychrobacter urativorans]|uniref:Nodulation protein NolW n=1 Tax=Psychrobacter urativorans TaxID=45610 RepID=A0A0M4T485_9GAMM|nr:hypothetical protein AOC03_06590 [Psychrobacter urativorans]